MIGIGRKDYGACDTNYFLNQEQQAIEREVQVQSVHAAVNINQVACRQTQIVDQDLPEILLGERPQRSYTAAFTFPFGATERSESFSGQDCLGEFAKSHYLINRAAADSHDPNHGSAPGVAHAETNQSDAIAGFHAALVNCALQGDRDCRGNSVAAILHINPELVGRKFQFGAQPLQDEFVRLMGNHEIDLIERKAGLLQQLLQRRRNGPQGKTEDVPAVHEKVFV